MLKMSAAVLGVMIPSLVASQEIASRSYADTLLRQVLHHHRRAESIEVTATGSKGQVIHVQANRTRLVKAAATITAPLANALGQVIGSVSIQMRNGPAAEVATIAAGLSRHIYAVDVLLEPDPFVEGAHASPYAQAIVERVLVRHRALVTLALHVAVPGAPNRIIASNFGRIGKLADKDDIHVIADGAVLRELTNSGRRFAVELPLHDRGGRTIGALSTSFLVGPEANTPAAYVEAVAVREEMARAIPSLAALAR